jgi:hypothetical protein
MAGLSNVYLLSSVSNVVTLSNAFTQFSNNQWKNNGPNLFVMGSNVGIGTSTITSNVTLDIVGQTRINGYTPGVVRRNHGAPDHTSPTSRAAMDTLIANNPVQLTTIVSNINLLSAGSTTFILTFIGYLRVETPGLYTFGTNPDDASDVFINDQLVAHRYGQGGVAASGTPQGTQMSVQLPVGYHKLTYRVENSAAVGGYQFLWRRPDAGAFEIVPSSALFHDVTDRFGASNVAYPLEVIGDVNVTGNYRANGAIVPQWNANGSNVFVTGSNVGIGTNTPRVALDVLGNTLVSGNMGVSSSITLSNTNVIASRSETINLSVINRRMGATNAMRNKAVSTWTTRTPATDNTWLAICWSSELSIFVAVSDSGTGNRVMTSPDGITWTSRVSAANNAWRSVIWSPELFLFVAVATTGTGNRIMTSPDGINWTIRTSPSDNGWLSVCWSPELSIFVAVASSQVMTSSDGVNWTTRVAAASIGWRSVCWSPELSIFVAVATTGTGNRVMTSSDGITWTSRTSAADHSWNSVCWSPELSIFVAVANTGTGNRVMTSSDGITWTTRTSAADNNWNSVCWSPELYLFVAVASTGTGSDRVMTSHDGITWTARTSAADNAWNSVCWSPELSIFVAVANTGTGNRVMTTLPTIPAPQSALITNPSHMTVNPINGHVGVGMSNPTYDLDVVGDVNITGNYRVNGAVFTGSLQWTTSGSNVTYSTGAVGIGTTTPNYALDVRGLVSHQPTTFSESNFTGGPYTRSSQWGTAGTTHSIPTSAFIPNNSDNCAGVMYIYTTNKGISPSKSGCAIVNWVKRFGIGVAGAVVSTQQVGMTTFSVAVGTPNNTITATTDADCRVSWMVHGAV